MKKKYLNKLLFVTVITLLFLLGCASTKHPASSSQLVPSTSSVVIYWDKPDRPYMEIGTIKVKAHSDTAMLEKLKQKAMEMGANGVIIKSVENQLRYDAHLWFLLVAPIQAEGVAIKFEDTSLEK
jgi:hypothetical protein